MIWWIVLFMLLSVNTFLAETLQYKRDLRDVHRFQTESVDDIAIYGMIFIKTITTLQLSGREINVLSPFSMFNTSLQ